MVYISYCLFIILFSGSIRNQEDIDSQLVDPAVPEQINLDSDPFNWQTMEEVAEFHPYVVALLDNRYSYRCTGSIVNKDTVVTAANCISENLKYIGLGLAFIDSGNYINNNSLKRIKSTELSSDPITKDDDKVSLYQDKIGLVFSVTSDLVKYFGFVDIFIYEYILGNPFSFVTVGYGTIPEKHGTALQKRTYNETFCPNPEWEAVCGREYFEGHKFEEDTLGKGAAAYYNGELYGIWGWKCGVFATEMLNGSCDIYTKLVFVKLRDSPWKPERIVLRKVVRLKNAAQKNTIVIHIILLLLFIVLMFQK